MPRKSHLYNYHAETGKLTEFGGFEMPLWYKGIIDEHNAVRNAAGLFDVSHMGRFSIRGKDATKFLDSILPSNVGKVKEKRAFYSAICNESGGILDDAVTNKFDAENYLMVVNASNHSKDFSWLETHCKQFSVAIEDLSDSIALMAFQGPLSLGILQKFADIDLAAIKRFGFEQCRIAEEKCLVSRTGYTGEDGFEIAVYDTTPDEPSRALKIWNRLLESGKNAGVLPCGLGARDSLRLEAGMCLYGQDIDDNTTLIEASLESIVDLQKSEDFVGRQVIENQAKNGTSRRRVSFSMLEAGIPRHGYSVVFGGAKVGAVTSGTFSPTVKRGIGMAYVPRTRSEVGTKILIQIRESEKAAEICNVPFYDTKRFGYRRVSGSG